MSNYVNETVAADLQLNRTKTDEPLISVIIPTYNRLPLLKEAVASVLKQTYTNWELIIVDDGSTDGTVEAIQKIDDPRIQLVVLSHTGHINEVMNAGTKISKGEWLAFLDSDDLWMAEKLDLQLNTLKKKTRWIYGGYELMDENRKTIYKSSARFTPLSGWILKEIILTRAGITICSVMIEKKFFEEIGRFSDDPNIRGDYEFTLRMAAKAEGAVIPEIVTRVREHSGRITKSRVFPFERTARTYETFIRSKPGREFEKLARKRLSYLLAEASVFRFANGDHRMAIRQLLQSFWMRDKFRHWLSALKRGTHAAFKKYFIHSAKKRKTKSVSVYTT